MHQNIARAYDCLQHEHSLEDDSSGAAFLI
jgi:hypothetical protein